MPRADLLLARIRVLLQQPVGAGDHAGRAIAALQAVLLVERLLQRVQRAALLHALDGRHLGAFALHRQHGAGLDRHLVQVDRAGPAVRGLAADVRPGVREPLAQGVDQELPRLDGHFDRLAVELERNLLCSRHGSSRPIPWPARAPPAARAASFRRTWRPCTPRRRAGRASAGRFSSPGAPPRSGSRRRSPCPRGRPRPSRAFSTVGPALVSAIATLATLLPFICSITAVAAVAKSPVLRLSFWYDQPLPAAGIGMRIWVRISFSAELRRVQAEEVAVGLDHALALGPVEHERGVQRQHQRGLVVRRIAVRDVAADGSLVAHLRIGDPAGALDQQRNLLGQQLGVAAGRSRWSSRRCGSRCPPREMPRSSAIRPRSIRWPGSAKRSFIIGSRLWPPASSLASGPSSPSSLSASATERGAW